MDNIPNFVLYGEQGEELFPDYLHIESIRARSLSHGWKFRPHRHHNLHQFFFIAQGGGRALIEELNHPLQDGLVIVMPPMAVHGFEFLPDTEGWVLTIPTPYLQRILEEEPLLLEYLSNIRIFQGDAETARQFRNLFAAIEKEHAATRTVRGLAVRGLVTLLACQILRACPAEEEGRQEAANQKQVILRNFQALIDEQFKARWPVARYADRLGITPTHLSRICRQVLHMPASELVTERSLLEARRLLIYTSLTIAEIAYDLGFTDPAHFSKFFREKTGRRPSEFRQTFTKRA